MPDGRRTALQLRIGAFVLVSLGVFLAVIYLLGAQARYFERKYDLYAEFTEVGGLIEGATVRLAGVQVGRVTDVSLPPQPGGKVRVTLTIARRFADRIRKNSEVRIVTQGLLGDRLVEITLGTPDQPPLSPRDTIRSQEPFEVARVLSEGADTLASVNRLALTLTGTLQRLDRAGTFEELAQAVRTGRRAVEQLEALGRDGAYQDLAATLRSARRITDEVERGRGWLHVLIYEEPETLRRLDGLLARAAEVLGRATDGDSAVAALLSPESGRAARSLLAAMEAVGRGAAGHQGEEGLVSALLFDPRYRAMAEDLRVVARNFREVSERLSRRQGLLGWLLSDEADNALGRAAADVQVAMGNLRLITERLQAGEGTLGGLLEDPTVYENLAAFLEGAQRSLLLRALIRSTIGSGSPPRAGAPGAR